jgi:hypothetical protein
MTLVLRSTKGSPLTYDEMDDNLVYLESQITSGSSPSSSSLSQTLSVGNQTSGSNIITSNGDTITAQNGMGQLDLRAQNTNGTVILSNDTGSLTSEFLYLSPGVVDLSSYTTGATLQLLTPTAVINIGGGTQTTFTLKNTSLVTQLALISGSIAFPNLPEYADNSAALAGGLIASHAYKTPSGDFKIVV